MAEATAAEMRMAVAVATAVDALLMARVAAVVAVAESGGSMAWHELHKREANDRACQHVSVGRERRRGNGR